ncbi:MAG: DUF1273 domain-containing protein [Ruminococcaceae bacterium]|nr:DUF1273 domain-containing protein [Oscillospiraceae bacterium]
MNASQPPYTCCFTGHRTLPNEQLPALSALLDRTVASLIKGQVTTFRTGGALGFDTLAALKVLDFRTRNPQLRLELCLPCRGQETGWSELAQQTYREILERADKIIVLRESYTSGCMHERNRFMVDGSQVCVGFCTSDKGGTAYTLRYAKNQGLRVINLAPLLDKF